MPQQDYAISLESQLAASADSGQLDIGRPVSATDMDLLHDRQVGQLYQLHQEIHKPLKPDNDV